MAVVLPRRPIPLTAFDLASRYIGMREIPGEMSNPQILAMLKLDMEWPSHDEVPWCSAFLNHVFWLLRLGRSKSLMARSWLRCGAAVPLTAAEVGFDVVVLKRGGADQPGPEELDAPGHVGLFAGHEADLAQVQVLGGNQGDAVSTAPFPVARILGVRRI